MNYKDTWEVDEQGKKFVFTVEMKRRLEQKGLPIEPESLGQLKTVKKSPRPQAKKAGPAPIAVNEPDVIQIDPESGKYIGMLKWYNPARGYGFISRGGGEDIFFHKTSTIGDPTDLDEGQSVLYDVEDRPKGPEATEVEPYYEKTSAIGDPTELDEEQAANEDFEDSSNGSEAGAFDPDIETSSKVGDPAELDEEQQAIVEDVDDRTNESEAGEVEFHNNDPE
jgi:CspA family cold shock protein